MKKAVLYYLAGLLVALFAATDASAIPAFARQTGMACSACHYMHFPALNSFGRSFKEGGYTMVGSEEKIESDDLSLPATLNAALVGYMSYSKSNGTTGSAQYAGSKDTNDGQLQIPLQVSLFLGGRASDHIGFESEINMANAGVATGTAGIIRLKVMDMYDVGSVKLGIVPFSTGLGAADSFEVLNTGAVAVHAFNQGSGPTLNFTGTSSALTTILPQLSGISVVSAQQYLGTATAATGVALVGSNDNFFFNVAKWGANHGAGSSGGPSSNYLRAAWTPGDLITGFDTAMGFQVWSGQSLTDSVVTGTTGMVATKASAVDFQMMGDVLGDKPFLLVASYAEAPAVAANGLLDGNNLFNGGTQTRSSANIGAELGVIPNKASVQVAYRHANSGLDLSAYGGSSNATDNAYMLGATYALALNVRTELTYTKGSGDMYNQTAYNGYVKANSGAAWAGNIPTSMIFADVAFGF